MDNKSESLPLLIARDKNAKICKEDYKLGWLFQDDVSYFWMVWGSSINLQSALKIAKQVLVEQGERKVYLSDRPLTRDAVVHGPLDGLKAIEREGA